MNRDHGDRLQALFRMFTYCSAEADAAFMAGEQERGEWWIEFRSKLYSLRWL